MKGLLARLGRHRAVGVSIGERDITLSQVADTVLGPVQIVCRSEVYEPDHLEAALQRLLSPLFNRRQRSRMPTAVGLSPLRVFFSTRPIRSANSDASPQVLLHEVLQSPNVNIDDMAVEVVRAEPGRRKVASIVSCRKKYLGGVLTALEGCGIRPSRVEPEPCALLRLASYQHPAPRRARTVVRIFLNNGQGLAVVSAEHLPILWRSFVLAAGEEATAIRSTVRSLQTLVKHCGIETPLDAVLVHGRKDLAARFDKEGWQAESGCRLEWFDGPALEQKAAAYGLALGCLKPQKAAFDLARRFKPPATLRDIFPWGEVSLQAALLSCMALFLIHRGDEVRQAYQTVRAETARRTWLASAQEAQLEKEKKELTQKVDAVHRFVNNRILWTAYTHDIAARLPANATLASFQGVCELEQAGGKNLKISKPKKSLVLKAVAPIRKDGVVPQEIDDFLKSLRGHPLLQRDFPVVELADILSSQNKGTMPSAAVFTVIALPKADKADRPGGRPARGDSKRGGS